MTRRVKIAAADTLATINNHKAFVKNIASSSPKKETDMGWDSFNHHWAFLIKQLKDPENFRPAKPIPEKASRRKIYDPLTQEWVRFDFRRQGFQKLASVGQWHRRRVNPQKGMPKPGATYTKKTSVSLLPPNGRMRLFEQIHGVVLILDSERCKVKDRYIFDRNMITRDKPWYSGAPSNTIGRSNAEAIDAAHTTLDGIRKQQIRAMERTEGSDQVVLKWNECQVDLCADAVIGIGVPQNDLTRRLNAQYRQLLLLKHLGRDVPLFILTKEEEISEYTVFMQQTDLLNPKSAIDREFVEAITELRHELYFRSENSELSVTQNIFELIEMNRPEAVSVLLQVFPENIALERDKKTPLQWALQKEHFACVKEILKVGMSEKESALLGEALRKAAGFNRTETVLQLIELGAPLNWTPKNGGVHHCAIQHAISHENHAVLLALLEKGGASIANRVSKESVYGAPLVFALAKQDVKAVQLLVDHGATLDEPIVEMLANAGRWGDLFICIEAISCRVQKVLETSYGKSNNLSAYYESMLHEGQKIPEIVRWAIRIAIRKNASEALSKLSDLLDQWVDIEKRNIKQLMVMQPEKENRGKIATDALSENEVLFQTFSSQRRAIEMKNALELREEKKRQDILRASDFSFFEMTQSEKFARRVLEDKGELQKHRAQVQDCFTQNAKQIVDDFIARIKVQITVLDKEMLRPRFSLFKHKPSDRKAEKKQVLVETLVLLRQLQGENNVDVLAELRQVLQQHKKWDAGIGQTRTGTLVKVAEGVMLQYAALKAAGDLAVSTVTSSLSRHI